MSKTWQAVFSRRMLVILLMGFSSGLPLALTAATLQAWMKDVGLNLAVIGVFSLVGLPYTLKFIWAPFLDRYVPPFFGRRRGWIVLFQLALVVAIAVMAYSDPLHNPWMFALIAFAVAFFSASQDVVVDAYRIEILPKEEFGLGAGISTMGYRLAMLTSGALALILADHIPWKDVYMLMALAMFVGIVASLWGEEPYVETKPKSLWDAVALPLLEFFKRKGIWLVVLFIVLYKIDVVFTLALMTPFLMDIGFTKTDIGVVTKVFGLVAVIAGTLAGGLWALRLGLYRALWIFGILQGLAGLSFMALAFVGNYYPMLVVAIVVENACSGMGNAAYAAFLMSLCDKRFTGTQYALLTSVMALSRIVIGSPSGVIVEHTGWVWYYFIAIVVAIPSLLLLPKLKSLIEKPV